jgi:LPXTG-motif cell wall-anchored protein
MAPMGSHRSHHVHCVQSVRSLRESWTAVCSIGHTASVPLEGSGWISGGLAAHMIRRVLLIAGLITASLFFFAGPARAQDYGGCSATASKTNVVPGDQITVSGSGAQANAAVTASVGGTRIGSGTASATGSFSFSATVPTNASGTVSVSVACGGDPARVASLTLTVAVTSAGGLPRTGSSDTIPATTVAIGLITAGAVALGISRRRRHGKTAA